MLTANRWAQPSPPQEVCNGHHSSHVFNVRQDCSLFQPEPRKFPPSTPLIIKAGGNMEEIWRKYGSAPCGESQGIGDSQRHWHERDRDCDSVLPVKRHIYSSPKCSGDMFGQRHKDMKGKWRGKYLFTLRRLHSTITIRTEYSERKHIEWLLADPTVCTGLCLKWAIWRERKGKRRKREMVVSGRL